MSFQRSESYGSRYSARLGAMARAHNFSTEFVFKFLRTSSSEANLGTSTGGTGNQIFRYICPVNRKVFLERVTTKIIAKGLDPADFGGGGALTNGLKLQVLDTSSAGANVSLDFLDGQTIKKNADWHILAGTDLEILGSTAPQADDGVYSVRWTIGKAGFGLELDPGQNLAVTTQDDLTPSTAITEMFMMVQGAIFSST